MKPFESSRFVRKVALSEFDQLEDGVEEGEEEPSFSPDLKLFVGNLPFSVDSAALAEIFERAGNVEMVEVILLILSYFAINVLGNINFAD